MPPRDWDAETYERLSVPVAAMGLDVLDRLELSGSEIVLDAGCGTGRVTAVLAERLPRGRVVAVDASPAMVREARARLPANVDVRHGDLLELDAGEPVHAVLSTATLHWIRDHDRVFGRLHAALRPGGRLVAQCGGAGNIAAVRAAIERAARRPAFRAALDGWDGPWTFATPAETEERLRGAGFTDVWCWRSHVVVEPQDPPAYFACVILGDHLLRLPEGDREAFVAAVLDELDDTRAVRYVRLNILARRAPV